MTSTLDAAAIQDKARRRNAALVNAALISFNGTSTSPDMAASISAALSALAEHWRAEGAEILAANRRGAKGVSAQLVHAASLAAGVAVSLRQTGVGDIEPDARRGGPVEQYDNPSAPEVETPIVAPHVETMMAAEIKRTETLTVDQQIEAAFGSPTNGHGPAVGAETVAVDDARAYITGEAAPTMTEDEAMPTPMGVPPLAQRPEIIEPLPSTAADPFADPLAPGRTSYAGKVFTFADLLAPHEPFTLPEHLSHSQIEQLSDCGLKYRLLRLEGVTEVPGWSTIGGNALHAAVATLERSLAERGGTTEVTAALLPDPAGVKDAWHAAFTAEISRAVAEHPGVKMIDWYAAKGGKEGFTWWQVEGEAMLARYVAQREDWSRRWVILRTPDGVPIIEHEFLIDVDGIAFKGIIDQAWFARGDHGTLLIRDVKSGASKPTDTFQLGEYAHALSSLGVNGRVVQGAYWMARTGEHVAEVADLTARHPRAELVYRLTMAQAMKSAGIFAPRPSSYCVSCSAAGACPVRAS